MVADLVNPLPLAAATEAAGALSDIALLLLGAKVGDEVFKRIGQPAIVGEILGGLLVGPAVLGWVEPRNAIELFAELGVIFLLFWVGLETRISELREVGNKALRVGAGGIALPFAAGLGGALAFGESTSTAVFMGAALAATSTAITSATLVEKDLVDSRPARIVLGAAIVDDILALMLLAVAISTAEGNVDVLQLGSVVLLSLAFVAFFALGGTRIMAARPQILQEPEFAKSPLLPAVLLCIGMAALAAEVGLATIIGAFLAGLMVAETKEQHPIEEEVEGLYAFFAPFFFAFIGLQLDLDAFTDPETLALLAGVTVLAVVTKLAAAYPAAAGLPGRERWTVAIGMVPRGEVGIIAAGIGATAGVIDEQLFAVVVGMSVLTTILVPPILSRVASGIEAPDRAEQTA